MVMRCYYKILLDDRNARKPARSRIIVDGYVISWYCVLWPTTMIMMVDLADAAISFHALSERLTRKGQELSVRVEIQREEIFTAMHRV